MTRQMFKSRYIALARWMIVAWLVGLPWAQADDATPPVGPAPALSVGDHQALPAARSLRAELAAALARKSPLVVMVSLDGCPYCRVARQSHLLPMAREGLPVVQVDFHSAQAVIDFTGQKRTHEELIRDWKVTVAPTLLFFGPGGREVAERMQGTYLPDFYRTYLEQRLAQARSKL